MKAIWSSVWPRRLLTAAGLWLLPFASRAAPGAAATPDYSTNAVDRMNCERQLNIIYGAIGQYRSQHDNQYPNKLSDLTPDFLHDPKVLICPFVQGHGGLRAWVKQFNVITPDPFTSYGYEFAPNPMGDNQWRGVPRKTWQDFKLRVAEELGPVVPIVRCLIHQPFLNLGMNGKIYESGLYWEKKFTTNDNFLTVGTLFTNSVPPPPRSPADFPPRDPRATARQLDLTGSYNATLSNAWQGFPGNHLARFPAGLQELGGIPFDVRGVIQLRGRDLPAPFPKNVDDIPARQKCSRIHFIHAVYAAYLPGITNGFYAIHYADGQVQEIPLIYGQNIADWWQDPQKNFSPSHAKVVWQGDNEAAKAYGKVLKLSRFTWENPRPEVEVATICFDSGPKAHAPFLLAITLE